jgi:uncharacterized protein YlxW (UPF0749 family)
MRRPSGLASVTLVLLVLGFLVVVQLRSQSSDAGLAGLSTQDLTVLVANLTSRNNELRDEIVALERQRDATQTAVERGDTSASQIRSDLARIEGWAGVLPVTGAGVRVLIDGPVPGDAVGQLVNELWNAGAEAVAIGDIRVVPGVVVSGPVGELTVSDAPLETPVVLTAVGQAEALSGSLTRAGGPIAQLAARFPDVSITATAADKLTVPATGRELTPQFGRPRI